jgi:hypothetical protein
MKQIFQSMWTRLVTPTARGQRGIALLLSLGVLSLLLVLAMSFAYTARTERQAAGVNADLVKARLFCKSAQERCMANVSAITSTFDDSDPGNLTVPVETPAYSTVFPASNAIMITPTSTATSLAVNAASLSYTDTRRFAGQMNTKFAVTAATDVIFVDGPTLWKWQEDWGTKWSPKVVLNMGHINVSTFDPTYPASSRMIGKMCYLALDESGKADLKITASPGSIVPAMSAFATACTGAQSWLQVCQQMGFNQAQFRDAYDAFRFHHNTHYVMTDGIMGKFDLARWYLVEKYSIEPSPTNKAVIFDSLDSGDTSGQAKVQEFLDNVPWFTSFNDSQGTWDSLDAKKKQIIANIVDYFDDDDTADHEETSPPRIYKDFIPTVGPDIITADGAFPQYCGIEYVPMIKQFRFKITNPIPLTGQPNNGTPADTTDDVPITVIVAAKIEMCFPFTIDAITQIDNADSLKANERKGVGARLTMDCDLEYDYTDTSKASPVLSKSVTGQMLTFSTSPTSAFAGSNPNCVSDAFTMTFPNLPNSSTLSTSDLKNVRIRVKKAILMRNSDSQPWDYARTGFTFSSTGTLGVSSSTPAMFVALKVDDPLQNHNKDDWFFDDSELTVFNPGAFSWVNGPSTVSASLKILNNYPLLDYAAFANIHRAESGKYLNICKYNMGVAGTAGGNVDLGDRNLLEQLWLRSFIFDANGTTVKAYDPVTTPSINAIHINPNSQNDSVLAEFYSWAGGTTVAGALTKTSTANPYYGPTACLDKIGSAFAGSSMSGYAKAYTLFNAEKFMSPKYTYHTGVVVGESWFDVNNPTVSDKLLAESKAIFTFSNNALAMGYTGTKEMINQKLSYPSGYGISTTGNPHYYFLGRSPTTGNRYYISTFTVDSWHKARRCAEDVGGHLISTPGGLTFISNLSASLKTKTNLADGFWVGIYRSGDVAPQKPSAPDKITWTSVAGVVYTTANLTWQGGKYGATVNDVPGVASTSAVVIADDNGECDDVDISNGGTPLRIVIETDKEKRVIPYNRYLEE